MASIWVDQWLLQEHKIRLGLEEDLPQAAIDECARQQHNLRHMRSCLVMTDPEKAVVMYFPMAGQELYFFPTVQPLLPHREFTLPRRAVIYATSDFSTVVALDQRGSPKFAPVRYYLP
jgi:hypothetical protein